MVRRNFGRIDVTVIGDATDQQHCADQHADSRGYSPDQFVWITFNSCQCGYPAADANNRKNHKQLRHKSGSAEDCKYEAGDGGLADRLKFIVAVGVV